MERERELFVSKLGDCLKRSLRRPCFLGFLDESEAAFCREFLKREETAWMLWGGYEEAERVMAGFFPDYIRPVPEEFPLRALTVRFRKEDALGHRDFLGSLMGLGIERSVLGDILIGEGKAVVFLKEEISRYVQDNLRKIGRTGVKISEGIEGPLPVIREYKDITGVIASNRLDCMSALLCHTSREKAGRFVSAGLVMVNHREILEGSARIHEGDIISVRGHGKFVIDSFGPPTSKGRLTVKCRKYQ